MTEGCFFAERPRQPVCRARQCVRPSDVFQPVVITTSSLNNSSNIVPVHKACQCLKTAAGHCGDEPGQWLSAQEVLCCVGDLLVVADRNNCRCHCKNDITF